MQKAERQQLILEIIASRPIATQEELAAQLAEHGHIVTQASVSRDIDELAIAKSGGRYVLPRGSSTPGIEMLSVDTAGENLIVARCRPGLASAAAVLIDSANFSQIVGTIAGDDTIFIAVGSRSDQDLVIAELTRIFK